MALVVVIPPSLRHLRIAHRLVSLRFLLQVRGQTLHEAKAQLFLRSQYLTARIWASVDLVGLRACEAWRCYHLGLVKEDVQAEVMAVEGETPWLRRRGLAEESEIVGEFIHDLPTIDKLAKEVVNLHCTPRLLIPFR